MAEEFEKWCCLMELFKDFAGNMVILMIIMSGILNISAGSGYENYLKFIAGMITVIYALNSVYGIFSEGSLISGFGDISCPEVSFESAEEERNRMINEYAMSRMEEEIEASLVMSGYGETDIKIKEDNGVYRVTFFNDNKDNAPSIKKYIADFYHMESEYVSEQTEAVDE